MPSAVRVLENRRFYLSPRFHNLHTAVRPIRALWQAPLSNAPIIRSVDGALTT